MRPLSRFVASGMMAGTLFACAAAWAGSFSSPTGFGTSWPNAKNVSAAPGWNVYVFAQDGVKYIQINDTAGHVLAGVAAANGQYLVLPLGSDASRVSTPQRPQVSLSVAPTIPVYHDAETTISAATQGGHTNWTVRGHAIPETQTYMLSGCDGDPGRCSGVQLLQQ